MKFALGLPLSCLAFAMCREAAAEQAKPLEYGPVVRADNQFAMDLYAQLDQEQPGKNLFFSPTSISLALAMTAAGARGQTEAEMAKTLHLGEDLTQTHAYYHKLLEQWNAVGEKRAYQLRVANRLWGQKGYAIRPEFLALTRQEYGAEMTLLDFAQAEAARREINQWVEQQTNDKIKDLIPAGALIAMTRLVLTNAVYFKGDWVKPFDKKDTEGGGLHGLGPGESESAADAPEGRVGLCGRRDAPGAGDALYGPGAVDGRAAAEESGRAAGTGEVDFGRKARLAAVEAPRSRGRSPSCPSSKWKPPSASSRRWRRWA